MAVRIALEGLPNTRDLGGYPADGGRKIKKKRLIRSGALIKATPGDLDVLVTEYGLRRVIDFRTETERLQRPDPEIPGVINIHNPILNEAQTGITRETFGKDPRPYASLISHATELGDHAAEYMETLYESLAVSADAAAHYGAFLSLLLDEDNNGSVLWHCSAGKDRVGLGTALLLSVLGVPRELILEDFAASGIFLAGETARMVAVAREQTSDEKILRNLELINGVKASYLASAFHAMEMKYGSVENYLCEAAGFGAEEQEKIRERYLE